ncbi:MAG: zf-HC2 domain-containing protein [Calditrichaceae bacterium]|jgi:anti-sigma factor RsiW
MMHCDTIKEKLSDYIDDAIEDNLRSQFNTHLEACIDCERLVQRVKSITTKLSQVTAVKTSPEFDKNLRTKILESGNPAKSAVPVKTVVYGLSGLTAAAAIYFMTTTTIFSGDPAQPPANFQTRSTIQTTPVNKQLPAVNIQPVDSNQGILAEDSIKLRTAPLENREIQLVDEEK